MKTPLQEDSTINKYTYIGLGTVLGLVGCVSPGGTNTPAPRPLGREIQSFHSLSKLAEQSVSLQPVEPRNTLSLGHALTLALMKNPELEAYSYDVRAAEARVLQARLRPNPDVEVEVESYGRDGSGSSLVESSVVLGQVIELGGKRRKRTRVAEAAGELSGWNYESKRLDVFTQTAQRFTELIAAQRRLELAKSFVTLSEQTCRAVGERVKAGKETPVQVTKAEAGLELARLDVMEAENNLAASRKILAASWGAEQPHFTKVAGDFDHVPEILPSEERVRRQLSLNPDIARKSAELALREAKLATAKAARIPDVRALVGVQHFEEDGSDALIFGFGVPLPLFDRNQGNISASSHELSKVRAERKAVETERVAELTRIYARLSSAQRKTLTLRSKVVPAMEEAFDAAHKGYREGKFGFLDVLDGQRSLFAAQSELIDAMFDFHIALSDMERITGTGIEELLEDKAEEI